jgi:hypothetical protein
MGRDSGHNKKMSRTLLRNIRRGEARVQIVAGKNHYGRRHCSDKLSYKRNAARTEAARLTKVYGVKMDAYECQVCGAWHVGKDGWA